MKELFEKKFICSDSSLVMKGKFKSLIGVALVFNEYNNFKKIYLKEIERCNKKYGLVTHKKLIKSEDIKKRTPSFNVHNYIDDLVESTFSKTKSIEFIYVTNSSTKKKIRLPWEKEKEQTGVAFIEKTLSQYYPIVPIWRYYYMTNNETDTVILDGINGKITKAWKHIGDKAKNIYIIPHGDQTHYCLSFCDILCTYINLNLRDIRFEEITEILKKLINKEKIMSEFVSDKLLEFIVPQYPHSIKPSNHYLHPLYLLINVKSQEMKQIIKDSELFDMAHQIAEINGGSSFNCDLKEDIFTLQNGDNVICLDKDGECQIREILKFYPNKKIKTYNIDSFITYAKTLLK